MVAVPLGPCSRREVKEQDEAKELPKLYDKALLRKHCTESVQWIDTATILMQTLVYI